MNEMLEEARILGELDGYRFASEVVKLLSSFGESFSKGNAKDAKEKISSICASIMDHTVMVDSDLLTDERRLGTYHDTFINTSAEMIVLAANFNPPDHMLDLLEQGSPRRIRISGAGRSGVPSGSARLRSEKK